MTHVTKRRKAVPVAEPPAAVPHTDADGGSGTHPGLPRWAGYAVAAALASGVTALFIAPRSSGTASHAAPYGAPAATEAADVSPPPGLTAGLAAGPAAVRDANWRFDHQQWPAAAAGYENALRLGVDTADLRTDMGSAYRFSGEPRKAIEQYEAARKLNPRHEQSLFNEGSVYAFDVHETPKAVSLWNEYLRRFPVGQSVREVRQFMASAEAAGGRPLPRPTEQVKDRGAAPRG